MPHIRFRGLNDATVAQISGQADKLAELIQTDAGNFTFESVQTYFFEKGVRTSGYPFVEVLWFPRSQEHKQALVDFLTQGIRVYESHEYITVIFQELEKTSYFENGKHF